MIVTKNNAQSLAETVADKIIDFVTSNKMKPGDKLPTETIMQQQMGIGRSTLREALKLMAARNILEIRQGSGTFISPKRGIPDDPLGLTFVYDDDYLAINLLDVRCMIEPEAAMLAAKNASPAQRRQLDAQCGVVEALIRQNAPYGDEDVVLHKLIAEASGNVIVGNLSYILHTSVSRTIIATSDALRDNNTLVYHRKLVDAIISGDTVSARNCMMIHINMLREYIADKLEKSRSDK